MNAVIDLHRVVPAWQALQSTLPLAHIETAADHAEATAVLNTLFSC